MASLRLNKLDIKEARDIVTASTCDIFNQNDQFKRRQLMKKYWATDVTCYSAFGASTGYDALDQLWNELHSDDKSRWVFERSGGLWLSFNLIMQPWVFGVSGEDPGMKGWDIIILNDDGKVTEIHAMIEGISTYAAAE